VAASCAGRVWSSAELFENTAFIDIPPFQLTNTL
jgi:hypothetical protein